MFLVNDNQPEIPDWREDRRARSDDNVGFAVMDPVPFIMPLSERKMTVKNGNSVAEPAGKAFDRLRR
jgi:hypothetical protein